MHVTPENIEEYFARYAWSYTRSSEDTWITGVRTSVSSFRIFVRLSEHWVYFVINPFVVAPPKPIDRIRFYYHVLRLNLDMNMAKFGLDNDGDLFLAVELPTENFNYSHFADALNGISHHAERLYSEVFNLAHNSEMVKGRYDEELNEDDLPASEDDDDSLPMDDFDLPDELINDSGERNPIIAGKEVRIVDDENGFRIEFETAHDLDEEDDDEKIEKSDDEPDTSSTSDSDDTSDESDDSTPDSETSDSEDDTE